MSFNVNKLKELVANSQYGGFATGSKYDVQFLPKKPASLTGVLTSELQTLRFLCEAVSIPTRSLSTQDHQIYGAPQKMPYTSGYTEAAFSFYLTESFAQRKLFEAWQNMIIDPNSGNVGFFDDYSCTIEIKKFSRTASDPNVSSPDHSVRLINAFPSIVGEVQLSHAGGNEILKQPVTFVYEKWLSGSVGGANFASAGSTGAPFVDATSTG